MSTDTVGNVISEKMTYLWKIPNFRSYAEHENGKGLLSPVFTTYHSEKNSPNVIKNLQWRLKVYPTGESEANKKYISMYLVNCNEFEVTTMNELILVGSSTSDNISISSDSEDTFKIKGNAGDGWGCAKMEERELIFSEQSKFLVNDTLTISCIISETSINPDDQESTSATYLEVFNHFENLLTTGDLSDVTFVIGEKSMQLHKAILSASSPVFQSMFIKSAEGAAENNVKQVKISLDVDYDVIMEMFRYIYARKVNNIENIAGDLFVAADKYSITGLRELCEKTLCKSLDEENALKQLELAVKYNATKLKSKTVEFVVKNLKKIVRTEEFKTLSPDCKDELLINIADKQ